jgi:hypothetical protein
MSTMDSLQVKTMKALVGSHNIAEFRPCATYNSILNCVEFFVKEGSCNEIFYNDRDISLYYSTGGDSRWIGVCFWNKSPGDLKQMMKEGCRGPYLNYSYQFDLYSAFLDAQKNSGPMCSVYGHGKILSLTIDNFPINDLFE